MPRFARVVIPQCPHHITQRGNNRRPIFFNSTDREVYLGLLRQYAALHATDILGFCLMTNHVHLVAIPRAADSMAKLLRNVQMRYSQYRNALEQSTGHLWQGRYYSCPVEPARLASVMRYVELNPVRAGIEREAGDYEWSSAPVHLGAPDRRTLLALEDWFASWAPEQWRTVLDQAAGDTAAIREATYGGRPLGSGEFVTVLERHAGRRLGKGLAGRPRRPTAVAAAEI